MLQAWQASRPHREALFTAETELVALAHELRDKQAALSQDQRSARKREIAELQTHADREREAARRPFEDLKKRFPQAKIGFAEATFGEDPD
jgi:hypothetical protein